MEGTCHYCESGTSKLTLITKSGVGEIKVCPDCITEHHTTQSDNAIDSINSLVITNDHGYYHAEGPFNVVHDGTLWEIIINTEDWNEHKHGLRDREGDGCVLLADCKPVGGGIVDTIDQPEGEDMVIFVVDQYASGEL